MCPPKPPDLAQQHKVSGGRVFLPNFTPASFNPSVFSSTSSASGSPGHSLRHPLQRRHPIIPDTVKLPLGVFNKPAALGHQTGTPSGSQPFNYVRRRVAPGRRKDSTQSLYINDPDCDLLLDFSSCLPSAPSTSTSMVAASPQDHSRDTTASKDQRRFSDPEIPYGGNDI